MKLAARAAAAVQDSSAISTAKSSTEKQKDDWKRPCCRRRSSSGSSEWQRKAGASDSKTRAEELLEMWTRRERNQEFAHARRDASKKYEAGGGRNEWTGEEKGDMQLTGSIRSGQRKKNDVIKLE